MEELGVEPLHCLLDKREVWSSLKTESVKKVGIEVEICNKVTIPKTHVELESQKDEESGNSTGRPYGHLTSGTVLQRLISSLSRK